MPHPVYRVFVPKVNPVVKDINSADKISRLTFKKKLLLTSIGPHSAKVWHIINIIVVEDPVAENVKLRSSIVKPINLRSVQSRTVDSTSCVEINPIPLDNYITCPVPHHFDIVVFSIHAHQNSKT